MAIRNVSSSGVQRFSSAHHQHSNSKFKGGIATTTITRLEQAKRPPSAFISHIFDQLDRSGIVGSTGNFDEYETNDLVLTSSFPNYPTRIAATVDESFSRTWESPPKSSTHYRGLLGHSPPLSAQDRGSSAYCSGLVVEGQHTGHEVMLQAPFRRNPPSSSVMNVGNSAKRRHSPNYSVFSEQEKILLAEELVKMSQKIIQLKAEIQELKSAINMRELEISNLNAQLHAQTEEQSTTAMNFKRATEDLQLSLIQREQYCLTFSHRLQTLQAEREALFYTTEVERNRWKTAEAQLKKRIFELEGLYKELLEQVERSDQLRFQLSSGQSTRFQADEAKVRQLSRSVESERTKAVYLQKEIEGYLHRDESLSIELARSKATAEQYHSYIATVAQPQFAVVRSETLSPVNPRGFDVEQGLVLVPLPLLLNGLRIKEII